MNETVIEEAKKELAVLNIAVRDYELHENFEDLEKSYTAIKDLRVTLGKHLSKERVRLTREGKLKKEK